MTIQDLVDRLNAIIVARDARIVKQSLRIYELATELRRRIQDDRELAIGADKFECGFGPCDTAAINERYDAMIRRWQL